MRPNAYHPASEELYAYRDGELAADKRSLIEAHVLVCALCRQRIDDLSRIESDLRLRPDAVGEDYYARMTESVLARLEGAEDASSVARARERELGPESGRIDRRHPDAADEDPERIRRSLRLPWIGITGTAAAAVAVVVVVVMLAQRQSEWVRAPRPGVLRDTPGEAPSTGSDSMVARRDAGSGTAGPVASSRSKDQRQAKQKATANVESQQGKVGVAPREDELDRSRLEERAIVTSQKRALSKEEAARDAATQQKLGSTTAEGAPSAAAPPTAARFRSLNAPPGEAYAEILRTHRLPILWSPSVSSDALLAAEPDLRLVYQTGRAGADSGRIRLYLAEAERLKLGASPDASAVEEVAHHYRRAIALAENDAPLADLARRRLADLLERANRSTP